MKGTRRRLVTPDLAIVTERVRVPRPFGVATTVPTEMAPADDGHA